MNAPKDQVTKVTLSDNQSEQKQYEKPDIIYRAPLEAMASACGTSPGKADAGCTLANS